MKILANFSHPLTVAAKAALVEMVGPVEEVIVPVHLDMSGNLGQQLEAQVAAAPERVDFIIPPSLKFAAAFVAARLHPGAPLAMVVLARKGLAGFVPVEIVELR